LDSVSDEEDIELLHNYYNIRDISNQKQIELKELLEKKRSIVASSRRSENPFFIDKNKPLFLNKDRNLKNGDKVEKYVFFLNNLKI